MKITKYKNIIPKQLNINSKILILGCGLSDHNTIKANKQDIEYHDEFGLINLYDEYILNGYNLLCNLKKYPNLIISDINIDNTFNLEKFYLTKKILKTKYKKYYLNNGYIKHDELSKKILFDKFIIIDITKDLHKLDMYDYIDLRNVIHFKELNLNKLTIIKDLYTHLNINGELLIQLYTKNPNPYYSVLTDIEKIEIKKNYNCVIDTNIFGENNEYETCYIKIFKK